MKNPTDRQLSPALALVQLLSEHPVRPETSWSIYDATLEGRVYGPLAGGVQAVDWWAEVLGCAPQVRHEYEYDGERLRVLELAGCWRDVHVVVQVSLLASEVVLVPTLVTMSDGTVLVPAVAA